MSPFARNTAVSRVSVAALTALLRRRTAAVTIITATTSLSSHCGRHVHPLSCPPCQPHSAITLQRRLYAAGPSSGSNTSAGASGNSGHGGGGANASSTGSGNGAPHHGGSGASGSSSGGSGGNKNVKAAQAKKKMKVKKGKANWRSKHKRVPGKTASATAAGASSPSTSGGSAGSAGGASGTSSSSHTAAASARPRPDTRRLKAKTRPTTSAASPAGAAPSSAAGKLKQRSAGRKKLIARRGASRRLNTRTGGRGGGGAAAQGKGGAAASAATSSSAAGGAAAGGNKAVAHAKKKHKKVRICVLSSSYDGADSATANVDNYWCTPQHYMKKDRHKYTFADVAMKKIDSYRTVRELVTSNKYDVFFNLCDGGRDEKRAGVDVVEALEEHNAAFTGTDSRSFEPSKIDMKLMVGSSGVKVPNFVLLDNAESLAKKCRHLKFPVIVKHLSGYASVGINKDNRCDNLDQLKSKVRTFIKEYNHALVEEFIRGREGTVLACADPGSPFGVKVFKPLMFNFLQNNDDFAYFDKKWTMECNDQAYGFLPAADPAYPAIVEMARNAFKYIMNGVGYGRSDFRIDEQTGVPYFLEINPNCGMWYSPKDGGDFADVMVEGDPHWNHERFVANAVARALKEQAARKPWYFISHDRNGQFSTRASKTVPEGKCLFGDAIHPIPVVSKALYKLGEEDATVGCVICRGDGIHHAVALRHSCEPNMQFVHGRTLLFAAKRQINVGEELTVDYATLRDESMPHFACSCGTQNCRSVIFPMPATPRTVEAKAMKRLLREKRVVWLKEKADREAERMLKKRASTTGGAAGGSSAGGSGSSGSSSSSSNSGGGNGGASSTSSGGGGNSGSGGGSSGGGGSSK